jgi:hypothetical protein
MKRIIIKTLEEKKTISNKILQKIPPKIHKKQKKIDWKFGSQNGRWWEMSRHASNFCSVSGGHVTQCNIFLLG